MNVSTTGGFHGQKGEDYSTETKKLKQELAEKDSKIKDINSIITQL